MFADPVKLIRFVILVLSIFTPAAGQEKYIQLCRNHKSQSKGIEPTIHARDFAPFQVDAFDITNTAQSTQLVHHFDAHGLEFQVICVCPTCTDFQEYFKHLFKRLNSFRTIWLIVFSTTSNLPGQNVSMDENNDTAFIKEFQETFHSFESKLTDMIYLYTPTENLAEYHTIEVYKSEEYWITRNLGYLASLADFLNSVYCSGRFNGLTLRVVAYMDPLYIEEFRMEETTPGDYQLVDGTTVGLFLALQIVLNFTYIVIPGTDWIELDSTTGQLTGMGKQLLDNEADLSISLNGLHLFRLARGLKYLQPLHASRICTFFKTPNLASTHNMIFLPFSKTVWYALLFFNALVLGSVLFGDLSFYRRPLLSSISRMSDASLQVFSIMTLQGSIFTDVSGSFRKICCLTAHLMSILVFTYYTGAFYSVISAPRSLVNNFHDFSYYGFTIITDPHEAELVNEFTLDSSEFSAITAASDKLFTTTEDTIYQMSLQDSSIAFIFWPVGFYSAASSLNITAAHLCQIQCLPARNSASRVKTGMALARKSPLSGFLNYGTIKIIERGIQRRFGIQMDSNAEKHCAHFLRTTISLDLYQFRKVFAVLGTGVMLALLVYKFETYFIEKTLKKY